MKLKRLHKSEFFHLDTDELIEKYKNLPTEALQRLEIRYIRSYLSNYGGAVVGISTTVKTFGAAFPVPMFSARIGYIAQTKLELIQLELVGRSVQLRYPTWKDAGHALAGIAAGQIIGDWFSDEAEKLLTGPSSGVEEIVNQTPGLQEVQNEILRAAPGEAIQAAYLAAIDRPPPSTCPRPRRGKFQRLKCAACAMHFDTSYESWVHCCECSETYDLCNECAQTTKHNPEHQLYIMHGKKPKAHSSFRSMMGFNLECDGCEGYLQGEYYTCDDCRGKYDLCLGCYADGMWCKKHTKPLTRQHMCNSK